MTKGEGAAAGRKVEGKSPKNFHTRFGTIFSRGGMWYSLLVLPSLQAEEKEVALEDMRIKVYDFTLNSAEKVGGRDAKVVRYRFGEGGACPDDAEVTLWIDAKSLLPLKRTFITKLDVMRVTEVYSEFKLDPKLDAGVFVIPK